MVPTAPPVKSITPAIWVGVFTLIRVPCLGLLVIVRSGKEICAEPVARQDVMPGHAAAQLARGVGWAAGAHENHVGFEQRRGNLGVIRAELRTQLARRDQADPRAKVLQAVREKLGYPPDDLSRIQLESRRRFQQRQARLQAGRGHLHVAQLVPLLVRTMSREVEARPLEGGPVEAGYEPPHHGPRHQLEPAEPVQEVGREEAEVEFWWVGETARHVGTVVHKWLQRMAEDELRGWTKERIQSLGPRFAEELQRRGVQPSEIKKAAALVSEALSNTIEDERGRWLLGPHAESWSEYRFRTADGKRLVADRRIREASGEHWVVDYKTSSHEGADLNGFLEREKERYAHQLAQYSEELNNARMGLYFPLLRGWREWESRKE